jgi:putative transferase (TIGR04331 family)
MKKIELVNLPHSSSISDKKPFHLVTSSSQDTWSTEENNLFLGKWCTPFSLMKNLNNYKFEYADAYIPPHEEKLKDLEYLAEISDKIFKDLVGELNKLHNTSRSERYWNIVLGHWFKRYIRLMFNRFTTVNLAFENYRISSFKISLPLQKLVTSDSQSFLYACNEEQWNQGLYLKVLKFLNYYPEAGTEKEISESGIEKELNIPAQKKSKLILRKIITGLLGIFSRSTDAFFISTYLPKAEELKLSLFLGQIPQFWISPKFNMPESEQLLRSKLNLKNETAIGFEKFVRELLAEVIPVCYVEGFNLLIEETQKLPWPSKPFFIFTSNNFDTDEVFKIWAADKIEKGTPYITGQHGNNYGTHFLHGAEDSPERSTADNFITWGWSNSSLKVIPGFNFKININNYRKYNPQGEILLIENHLPHNNEPWDVYPYHEQFQEEQFKFAEQLSADLKSKLLVRFHGGFRTSKWNEDLRWKEKMPEIKFETGESSITELISRSRLVVHSYDSTGILETLSLNIPTICFWSNGFEHLLPEARTHYEILKNASIYFANPEDCADFISKNFNTIEEWWATEKVQSARREFCNIYSRYEKYPAKKMKELLLKALNV